jgi:hypothetical protein
VIAPSLAKVAVVEDVREAEVAVVEALATIVVGLDSKLYLILLLAL